VDLPTLPLQAAQFIFVVLITAVLLAPVLAQRVRLPGILGLIVAGIIVGPNVLGLVERDGFVEILGGAGLLFLMFMAGLELDLRAAFGQRRTDTILFGVLTFAFPLLVGTGALLLWGFGALAAVLIASCWSSHTLIVYPIYQRLGIVQHRAVATAIGATMITNVSALVVLAIVVALEVGGTGAESWVVLGGGLLTLAVATLWGLPRLTRWFFAGLGGSRLAQVLYVLTMLFAASALASIVQLEAIVGAFFAGLGMNEHVPKKGVLGERLVFLGDSLLIPIFLLSVGMIIDPMSLFSGTTIVLLAITFTLQSLGGKFLAAVTFGKFRRYSRDEIGAMYSLTAAEAAATLAAIFVGFQVGLFGQEVVDAVIIVIMATCFTSTLLADRYAPRLPRPRPARTLGTNIVVPVANPTTAGPLTELAAAIASADAGTVTAINVLGPHVPRDEFDDHRAVLLESEAAALRSGVDASSRIRIDDSTTDGILHEVIEQGATSILMGWKGYASRREHLFGGITDRLLETIDVPVILCRPGRADRPSRVILIPPPAGQRDAAGKMQLMNTIAERLASRLRTEVIPIGSEVNVGSPVRSQTTALELLTTRSSTYEAIAKTAGSGDLIVLHAAGSVSAQLESLAGDHPDQTILVVVTR